MQFFPAPEGIRILKQYQDPQVLMVVRSGVCLRCGEGRRRERRPRGKQGEQGGEGGRILSPYVNAISRARSLSQRRLILPYQSNSKSSPTMWDTSRCTRSLAKTCGILYRIAFLKRAQPMRCSKRFRSCVSRASSPWGIFLPPILLLFLSNFECYRITDDPTLTEVVEFRKAKESFNVKILVNQGGIFESVVVSVLVKGKNIYPTKEEER